MSAGPAWVAGVLVSELEVPPVPSKKLHCEGGCDALIWMSLATLAAIPSGTKPTCLACASVMAEKAGQPIEPVIPAGVVAEFIEFLRSGGRHHTSN